MKLKKESKFIKLYIWFYNIKWYEKLPSNFCKFVLNLFFMFIGIVPVTIFNIPYFIWIFLNNIFKKWWYPNTGGFRTEKYSIDLFTSLGINIIIYVFYGMYLYIFKYHLIEPNLLFENINFYSFTAWWGGWGFFSILIFIAIGIFGFILLGTFWIIIKIIKFLIKEIKMNKYFKNLKEKTCSDIEWE